MTPERGWAIGLGLVLLAGVVLRLKGIHNPLLDHPGWRQGDTAAIARNFATLDFNPLHPQTDYDGPPPNYVELELQIVPFLAATLYKLFGIHEIFGRLISVAFSLGTIGMLAMFGRWLFGSWVAGLCAAALFAVYPGSVYYGRTFMPDTAMVFFLTAALFAGARFLVEQDTGSWRRFWPAAALAAAAILAKPVAAILIVPLAALSIARFGMTGTLRRPQTWLLLAAMVLPFIAYDAYLSSIAEWHWTRGITRLHVLPSLAASFSSWSGFSDKLRYFRLATGMFATTMAGPYGFGLFVLAWFVPVVRTARPLLWGWLAALVLYTFVVVTVQHVDYYLYPGLPLAALWSGAALARAVELCIALRIPRIGLAVATLVLFVLVALDGRARVRPYYAYSKTVYRTAKALDATLPRDTLVVMAHYDPSVLYYINRKGWEEDPYLWTAFDEQSAIRKGARYFIAIENNRFKRNVELYAWMQRFPKTYANATWPVYQTDYAKVLPGAEARWREFRRREKAGTLPSTS
ncbi:MAG: glycosyltransferase family 39 protein [Candidatus Eremiobacteraeota bacterium]|nr:glycosyltransferase family 39 protein [Candidatus Eremiobacteraeota bacterium]